MPERQGWRRRVFTGMTGDKILEHCLLSLSLSVFWLALFCGGRERMFSEDGSSIFVLFLADAFRQGTVCFLMLGALPTHVGNIDVQASSSALKLCIRFYDAAQQRFVFHDRRFR